MRNIEVIEAFVSKIKGKNKNNSLESTGLKLYSYNTCIAEWYLEYNCILLNTTYYSNTTSRHQNLLWKNFPLNAAVVTNNNIEKNTDSLKNNSNFVNILAIKYSNK